MPIIYLSPSAQENSLCVSGGAEEEWMNRLADALSREEEAAPPAPPAPPAPSKEEVLLTEIRDLLAKK